MFKLNSEVDKAELNEVFMKIQRMSQRGFRIGRVEEAVAKLGEMKDAAESDFYNKYGVSPGSPKQVAVLMEQLSDQLAMNGNLTNDIFEIGCIDGKWVTKKEVMEQLSELGYEFADELMNYRTISNQYSSIKQFIENMGSNRLVHPNISRTVTNRITTSKPNMLGIVKELTWAVIKPYKESNSLYSVDIKNQEPGILLGMLGIEKLQDALHSPDGFYTSCMKKLMIPKVSVNVIVVNKGVRRTYSMAEMKQLVPTEPTAYTPTIPSLKSVYIFGERVAAISVINTVTVVGEEPIIPETVRIETETGTFFDLPFKVSIPSKLKAGNYVFEGDIDGLTIEPTKEERKEFKTSWLALTYGSGAASIKKRCKHIDGEVMVERFNSIKELADFKNEISRKLRAGITQSVTVFGNVIESSAFTKSQTKRFMFNHPIQGTGADLLALLYTHAEQVFKEKGIEDKVGIYFTRHDEFVLEVDKDFEADKGESYIHELLKDTFEHQINDWAPFLVEVKKIENIEMKFSTDDLEE